MKVYILHAMTVDDWSKPFALVCERRAHGWRYRRRWAGYSGRWLKTSEAGLRFLLGRCQANTVLIHEHVNPD